MTLAAETGAATESEVTAPADWELGAVEAFARRVIALFKTPVMVEETEVFTSVSIGISIYPDDGVELVTLEKNADMALGEAKRDGKRK